MKLEDIKIGMKVRLLGKHGVSGSIVYDDINDWFEDKEGCVDIEQIKEQGFGYVTEIINDIKIWVSNSIGGNEYCFSSSDLESYEEEVHCLHTLEDRLRRGGTIGGSYHYEFIPTSIGTIGKVVCNCGEEFVFCDFL